MKYSYHSHTRWCRHATGEIEDYIEEAIRNHLQLFTICDHIMDDHAHFGPRAPWSDYPEYIMAVEKAEDKYQGRIELLRGFEAEYYPNMMSKYQEIRKKDNISVWILGQHESADRTINYYKMKDFEADTIQYKNDVLEGLSTGFFQILAHPDLTILNYRKPLPVLLDCMDEIFAYCEAHDIIVEINANGIRGNKAYPDKTVWELSKRYRLRYIVSSDAHSPDALCDQYVDKAEVFARNLDIKLDNV